MSAIFISYRRDDSAGYAGRLFDNLARQFGRDRVFMDIETLEPGVDFVNGIDQAIASCAAVIAMIGPQWIEARERDGRRRLDNPNDFIRLEIASALQRDVRVIPVLVHKAAMPAEEALPEPLKPLARLQAFDISDNRWDFDVERLAEVIGRLVPPTEPAAASTPAESPAAASRRGDRLTSTAEPLPARHRGAIAAAILLLAAVGTGGLWWLAQPTSPTEPVVEDRRPDLRTPAGGATDPVATPPDHSAGAVPDPAVPPPPVETPPEPVVPTIDAQRTAQIARLLADAEQDIAALRLTRPAGNSAYDRYQEILELDPNHPEAGNLLVAIAERYRGLVEEALNRGEPQTAQRHLDSARSIAPAADWLSPVQREIDRRLRQARAMPPEGARPVEAHETESGYGACAERCEHGRRACEAAIETDAEAECMRRRSQDCEQALEACMNDSSKLFVWGPDGLRAECGIQESDCLRQAATECADHGRRHRARCDRELEACLAECR